MPNTWSLERLLENLHRDIEHKLAVARRSIAHPTGKGDASEEVWLEMLKTYLPYRYQALKAYVVDSKGQFSDQIDVVICDRQYTPFIFSFQGQIVIPAEAVYAVFETKQTIDGALIAYAQDKAMSVRTLTRTSLPIPHAGGVYPPKPLPPIMAGILAFESEWQPPLGPSLTSHLATDDQNRQLDLGCVASHGVFTRTAEGGYDTILETKPATAFLFELIARLQQQATVPMIDVRAYAAWLSPDHGQDGSDS